MARAEVVGNAALRPAVIVVLGLIVHLILTYSVIDIHFQTPVIHDIPRVNISLPAAAQRVVLIVADGLRADKLFDSTDADGRALAPFLHEQATSSGVYGVSHTRPPTESRPGHVAMTAGFYEDPSALFSGWQANRVAFDSVFALVPKSWGFGSPDVVPMFAGQGQYQYSAYAAEMEDFAAADLTILDTWVFDQVKSFLQEVEEAGPQQHPLCRGPSLLFLHLLGLDSNAHAHGGPHAPQYLHNIQVVDEGVRRLVQHMDAVCGAGATAWVFTADHGMSDRASHGDGHPQNTQTPFVVWGAGLGVDGAGSAPPEGPGGRGWGMGAAGRVDVEQAQLAPLMALLLGRSPPLNSHALPPWILLHPDPQARAQATYVAARQLLEAHDKQQQLVSSCSIRYTPHPGLAAARAQLEAHYHAASSGGRWEEALLAADTLSRQAAAAITYLHRYDWKMLMAAVVAGFVSWMAFLLLQLLLLPASPAAMTCLSSPLPLLWVSLPPLVVCCSFLAARKAPLTYYLYFALPCLCGGEALRHKEVWVRCWRALPRDAVLRRALDAAAATGVLLGMAVGFQHRAAFFPLSVLLGARHAVTAWAAGGRAAALVPLVALSAAGAFVLLPLSSRQDSGTAAGCGLAAAALGMLVSRLPPMQRTPPLVPRSTTAAWLTVLQLAVVLAATAIVLLLGDQGRPPPVSSAALRSLLQHAARVMYILPPLLPPLLPPGANPWRMVLLALLPPYLLLSLSWEPAFYAALAAALSAWMWAEDVAAATGAAAAAGAAPLEDGGAPGPVTPHLEEQGRQQQQQQQTQKQLQVQDKKAEDADEEAEQQQQEEEAEQEPGREPAAAATVGWHEMWSAITFLHLALLSFFGQGNAATVASFDIGSVFRLTTVFNPFLMTALLLSKQFVPMLLVVMAFRMVVAGGRRSLFAAYVAVLVVSDVVSLALFFGVRGEGSWADIGSRLGYYGIVNAQVVVMLLLLGLGGLYCQPAVAVGMPLLSVPASQMR